MPYDILNRLSSTGSMYELNPRKKLDESLLPEPDPQGFNQEDKPSREPSSQNVQPSVNNTEDDTFDSMVDDITDHAEDNSKIEPVSKPQQPASNITQENINKYLKPKQQQVDYDALLKKAMSDEEGQRNEYKNMMALRYLTGGIAGIKPEMEGLEVYKPTALDTFQKRLGFEKSIAEDKRKQELSDPNHPMLPAYRELYKKVIGKDAPENATILDFENAGFKLDSSMKISSKQEIERSKLEQHAKDKASLADQAEKRLLLAKQLGEDSNTIKRLEIDAKNTRNDASIAARMLLGQENIESREGITDKKLTTQKEIAGKKAEQATTRDEQKSIEKSIQDTTAAIRPGNKNRELQPLLETRNRAEKLKSLVFDKPIIDNNGNITGYKLDKTSLLKLRELTAGLDSLITGSKGTQGGREDMFNSVSNLKTKAAEWEQKIKTNGVAEINDPETIRQMADLIRRQEEITNLQIGRATASRLNGLHPKTPEDKRNNLVAEIAQSYKVTPAEQELLTTYQYDPMDLNMFKNAGVDMNDLLDDNNEGMSDQEIRKKYFAKSNKVATGKPDLSNPSKGTPWNTPYGTK